MKKYLYIGLLVFACLALMIGTGAYFYLKSIQIDIGDDVNSDITNQDPAPKAKERTNIMVLGLDSGVPGTHSNRMGIRSDVIFVASLDFDSKEVNVVSIPRDTRVEIRGRGLEKINHAHAYGGAELAIDTVRNFLEIPIHYYVQVDFEGFKKIVDEIGGVELFVERDMRYTDQAQDLYININKGLQVLDGEKALQYVRYRRYPDGDIGRINAQQRFMSAVAKEVLQPHMVLKLPRIAPIITNYVKTNMMPIEIVTLAKNARNLDFNNINMAYLQGTDRYIDDISYWIVDETEKKEMVNKYFRDMDEDNSLVNVKILNGGGKRGAALITANNLKSKGYNVVGTGNADNFDYQNTTILYRNGSYESAKEIAEFLNINKLMENNNDEYENDITLILGKN